MSDRIIRVLHTIYSLAGGGAERQLTLLVNTANDACVKMDVLCVNDSRNDIDQGKVRMYKCPTKNRINVGLFPSLARTIKEFNPDVVHTWLPASITIPSMLLSKTYRIPCLFSYRNAMSFRRLLNLPEFGLCWIMADKIISNNPIDQSSIPYQRLFRRKNGLVISNAVVVDP